ASPDGNGTPHGEVEFGELFPGNFGSRIDGGSGLAHHKYLEGFPSAQAFLNQSLCFTACGTVTDRSHFQVIGICKLPQGVHGLFFLALWLMRKDGRVMKKISPFIQTRHLASCTKTRV